MKLFFCTEAKIKIFMDKENQKYLSLTDLCFKKRLKENLLARTLIKKKNSE